MTTATRHGAIELHCHIDGCVRPATIEALAEQQGVELKGPVSRLATAPKDCGSLVDYLSAIDVALDVLQTPEALYRAAYELVEDWRADGVAHGEARFAPDLHTRKGLTHREIVDAAASGLADGAAATGVSTSLILSCMRPADVSVTWDIVELAADHDAVAGVDVAGPEKGIPLLPHAPAFHAAKQAGLRITVHAGEADGPEQVWEAIDELGAERIGHGVRSIFDDRLVERLRDDRITLELCPTSNVQTTAIDRIENHPIEAFRARDVPISLSTDARTVSQVTLESEYALMRGVFGWDAGVWNAVQESALRAAFVDTDRGALLRSAMSGAVG